VLDDPERGEPALYRRGLANAERAVIAMNSDPGVTLRRLVLGRLLHLKDLDVANFHGVLPAMPLNLEAPFLADEGGRRPIVQTVGPRGRTSSAQPATLAL
jgi:hypothetical protein